MERTVTQPSEGSNSTIIQIDANVDVTQKLSAPTCVFGKDKCKIIIDKDDKNMERLKFVLPNDGKANGTTGSTQTYDMRSIIESIQELNRRTATFNCNVSFNSALEKFDTSAVPNDMFACDQDNDGLPAAHIGDVNLPAKDYIITINVNHQIDGDYTLIEPRWDSSGNAVYIGNDAYDKGFPLKLTLCEAVHGELPSDYIEKILNYFYEWNTFKEDFSCNGLAAIETISHIELIDCVDMTVTFRVLTEFEAGCWRYTSPRDFYTATEYADNITVRYNGTGSKFSISDPLQSPITKMILFKEITFTEHGTTTSSTIPKSDIAYTVQYVGTFAQIDGLNSIDLTHFDASSVTAMVRTFWEAYDVTSITFPDNFDTSNVKDMTALFTSCVNVKSLDIRTFDTTNVTKMRAMFSNLYRVKHISFSNRFNTSNVTDMYNMFVNLLSIERLILPESFNTTNVTTMHAMFYKNYQQAATTDRLNEELKDLLPISSVLVLPKSFIIQGVVWKTYNTADKQSNMYLFFNGLYSDSKYYDSWYTISCYKDTMLSLLAAVNYSIDNVYTDIKFNVDRFKWIVNGDPITDSLMNTWTDDQPRVFSTTSAIEFLTSKPYTIYDKNGNEIHNNFRFDEVKSVTDSGLINDQVVTIAASLTGDHVGLYQVDPFTRKAYQFIADSELNSYHVHVYSSVEYKIHVICIMWTRKNDSNIYYITDNCINEKTPPLYYTDYSKLKELPINLHNFGNSARPVILNRYSTNSFLLIIAMPSDGIVSDVCVYKTPYTYDDWVPSHENISALYITDFNTIFSELNTLSIVSWDGSEYKPSIGIPVDKIIPAFTNTTSTTNRIQISVMNYGDLYIYFGNGTKNESGLGIMDIKEVKAIAMPLQGCVRTLTNIININNTLITTYIGKTTTAGGDQWFIGTLKTNNAAWANPQCYVSTDNKYNFKPTGELIDFIIRGSVINIDAVHKKHILLNGEHIMVEPNDETAGASYFEFQKLDNTHILPKGFISTATAELSNISSMQHSYGQFFVNINTTNNDTDIYRIDCGNINMISHRNQYMTLATDSGLFYCYPPII